MSRVYFHSPSGEAELWGGERAWLSSLCNRVTLGILDIQHNHERISELINAAGERSYLARPAPADFAAFQKWRTSVEIAITVGFYDDAFTWKGKPLSMFSVELNTACRVGGDPLKLAARIHGQCEIYCWCEGKDRPWLAGIIDQGLASGLYRRDIGGLYRRGVGRAGGGDQSVGWETVADFIRSRDDEPVVMSYSVCDQFPSQHEAGWQPPEGADEDAWYDLPGDERWRIGMEALRAKRGKLRLDPDDWDGYCFDHGLSAFDILAADYAERLDRALLED